MPREHEDNGDNGIAIALEASADRWAELDGMIMRIAWDAEALAARRPFTWTDFARHVKRLRAFDPDVSAYDLGVLKDKLRPLIAP